MTPAVLVREATHNTVRMVFDVQDGFPIESVDVIQTAPIASIAWREDAWWIEPRAVVLVDEVPVMAPMRLRHGQAIAEVDPRGWRLRFLVGDRARSLEELRHVESVTDPLTGLFTRRVAYGLLGRMTSGVVMVADIDWLKNLNNQHGPVAGDTVLKRTAARLRAHVAWPNFLARYGGEEFLIGMPGVELADGRAFAEHLRQVCEPSIDYECFKLTATISIGIAGQIIGNLGLQAAEQAMTQAKMQGRNRVSG